MIDIKDVHDRLRQGDHINDDELDELIDKLEVAHQVLHELAYRPYLLMHVDIGSTLRACHGYREARQEKY